MYRRVLNAIQWNNSTKYSPAESKNIFDSVLSCPHLCYENGLFRIVLKRIYIRGKCRRKLNS